MKAMILAAGFGTRLKPLTDLKPKALVPVLNKPIIGHTIDYLKTYGFTDIAVNAHHHYKQIIEYLDEGRPFDIDINVLVESEILGTGGGIQNSKGFWDNDPFIVINSDILTDIRLDHAYESHKKSGCIATLVLHDYAQFNQITIDENGHITHFRSTSDIEKLAFTCIHIIQPELLSHIPEAKQSDIIACYTGLINSGIPVNAYISMNHYWRDIGSIGSYIQANKDMLAGDSFAAGTGLNMDPTARLEGWAVLGNNVVLEKNTVIERSIIWDNVTVKEGVTVTENIVTSNKKVEHNLYKEA